MSTNFPCGGSKYKISVNVHYLAMWWNQADIVEDLKQILLLGLNQPFGFG